MFKCGDCDKYYKWPQDLKRHFRIKHAGHGDTSQSKQGAKHNTKPVGKDNKSLSSNIKRGKSSSTKGLHDIKIKHKSSSKVESSSAKTSKAKSEPLKGSSSKRDDRSSSTSSVLNTNNDGSTNSSIYNGISSSSNISDSSDNLIINTSSSSLLSTCNDAYTNSSIRSGISSSNISNSNDYPINNTTASSSSTKQIETLKDSPAKAFQFRHPFTIPVNTLVNHDVM